jgi:hypothetical protein
MPRRYVIILSVILLLGIIFVWRHDVVQNDEPSSSTYLNSVFAIRGFRHAGVDVPTGESVTYKVDVGEEFKVAWKVENATENGQLIYRGPFGIGAGVASIPFGLTASQSAIQFLQFTPREAGVANFSLTVTGPGPEGTYTLTSNIVVEIK